MLTRLFKSQCHRGRYIYPDNCGEAVLILILIVSVPSGALHLS